MVEKLRQLKKKSQMTNQQIAEKSNIPESTVARIFSGKTPNPTIATVIAMARAMGGSAFDLMREVDENSTETASPRPSGLQDGEEASPLECGEGLAVACDKELSAAKTSKHTIADGPHLSEDGAVHKKIYEDMLRLYKDELRKKDVWIARLFWCLAGIVLFILFVLVFDILHPSFGFVKY